jgi:signal transduction histidine kinase/ActR/RegA family two-component response regulator
MAKSTQKLRRLIIATGVLLIASLTGSAAYDGWRLRQQLMAGTNRELGNLARALADESARSLLAVDVLLRDTATWYEQSATKLDAVSAALAARGASVPQVSVLSIVDSTGRQRFRSRDTHEPAADVSDRPYFQVQRDRTDAGMYINEPFVTRTEQLPGLVVSRRLSKPDGSFDGVVTAIVTLQRLQGMFSAIQLGDGSALLLALEDGTLVVRQPYIEGVEGTVKFPEVVAFREGPPVGRAVSPMDGRTKLVAAVGVGNRTLTLAITRDEEVALRPWHDAIWSAAVRTVVLSLLVMLTVSALLRQLRRLELGEDALRQSEERYAMAMEAANEGHAEWNLLEDTIFSSDKWNALHNVPPHVSIATLKDLQREIVLHPDDAVAVKAAVADHLEGRAPAIELEYRVRLPENHWRWVHLRGRRLLGGGGKPLRLFFAALDVSERKAAEADKAGLEARLQQTQRLEALGTLAGGIAHDFNNILGAILGFGQMTQQQVEPDSAARRHIDRVLQAGGRARLLVRRILDFSRSGVAERVPVDFQAVVEEVVAMLKPSLPVGLQISVRLDAGHAAVIGDATQLYQVVMNICTNAAQAMGDTGLMELTLPRVELRAPRSMLQGELGSGPHVRLDVADRGAGIAPEVLARMFDPFFTTKKVGEGTGLGLSVVHGIVADLGGAIDVVAREEGGTQVSVWLPVAGESAPVAPAIPSEWPRGHGEVVMIVDDERALVELAEELLAELGYEPVGFDSARNALRAFEADPARFDIVLTDETMPDMRGTDLAAALRALRADLPVILMSGNVSAGLEQRALESNVAELLRKPLALSDLADCLARVIGGVDRSRACAD